MFGRKNSNSEVVFPYSIAIVTGGTDQLPIYSFYNFSHKQKTLRGLKGVYCLTQGSGEQTIKLSYEEAMQHAYSRQRA